MNERESETKPGQVVEANETMCKGHCNITGGSQVAEQHTKLGLRGRGKKGRE